jgi:hypothetical protein
MTLEKITVLPDAVGKFSNGLLSIDSESNQFIKEVTASS